VPLTSVKAGKFRTEDKLKIDNTKTKQHPEKANNANSKIQQNKATWFSRF